MSIIKKIGNKIVSIQEKNKMYEVIIIGAGGFGREVYFFAKEILPVNQYRIKGFLDDNPGILNNYQLEVGIIGNLDHYDIKEQDRFLFAIGSIDTKKQLITKLKNRGAKFLSIIHPTATVAETAKIGEGVIIAPFCSVSVHAQIDDFVMMNAYATCGHDAKVGKYCILSPYAALNGFVILEEEVFLGTHATVTPYKKVGYKSKVSANSVVMRDVPPDSLVFGVPGRAI